MDLVRVGVVAAAMLISVAACGESGNGTTDDARAGPDLTPREGRVDVPGGRVWYRIVGTGEGTPLLLLHGGPGAPSTYLKPLAALGDDRPVIFYDQLGSGKSDHPNDTTLWTVPAFVERLDTLRRALGLTEVHLYGHSWGTILGTEYVLRHSEGVRSLILGSPALSIPRWVRDADSLVKTLPDSLQEAIREAVRTGNFATPGYEAATMAYYGRYLARRQPWSPDLDSTFAGLDTTVYYRMNGRSEFTMTGSLRDYDVTGRLPELRLPVLFITGEHDEASPPTVRYYAGLVPGAEVSIIPGAGHVTMHDNPEADVAAIRAFLRRVDAGETEAGRGAGGAGG